MKLQFVGLQRVRLGLVVNLRHGVRPLFRVTTTLVSVGVFLRWRIYRRNSIVLSN